jgi:hypothetical protein
MKKHGSKGPKNTLCRLSVNGITYTCTQVKAFKERWKEQFRLYNSVDETKPDRQYTLFCVELEEFCAQCPHEIPDDVINAYAKTFGRNGI